MSKKLAIRGHSTRGKEVIKLLEMIGGSNIHQYNGEANSYSYYISGNVILNDRLSIIEDDDFEIFTLEEFLEKYPFKVGELKDLQPDNISCIISEMRWNAQAKCVEYHAKFGPNDYGWYKVSDFCDDYQIEELNTVISGINLNSCDYADEVELNLGNYEIEVRDGRTYAVKKKPKYPTTYEECWKVRFEVDGETTLEEFHNVSGYYSGPLGALQKLLCCRDAYRKIAGEEMRLDKPWEPGEEDEIFIIGYNRISGIYKSQGICTDNFILSFPTAEMRDAFYENFEKKIEQCKELL